jgi:GNAT superfamily N-acetyltransferase
MSRSGVMTVIQGGRRLIRRPPAVVLRSAQGMAWYRAVGRRLVPGFDIEAATAADGEAVRRLLARGNTDTRPQPAPEAGVVSWVAKRKGRVTGFVQLVDVRDSSSPWAGVWLASLAVEGRRRGLGIGEALTRRVLEEAAKLELPRVLAVIEEDNDRALCLLAKLGFLPTAINALEPGLAAEGALSGRRHLILSKQLRGGPL